MAWLKRWWWVGVFIVAPVVVIGIGVLVASSIEDEKNRVAVYAAVVATVGILFTGAKNAYEMWEKDRERRKKEDDKREVLQAKAEYTYYDVGTLQVGVELYNAGSTVVPIKRVYLVVREGEKTETVEMVCSDFTTTATAFGKPYETADYKYRLNLPPKEHVRFHVESFGGAKAGAILKLEPDAFCIVVDSFAGEVARVPGAEIQEAIRQATAR